MYQAVLNSVENGNAHALVSFVERGFELQSNTSKCNDIFNAAAKNGFYKISQILINLLDIKDTLKISIKPLNSVSFGNLSIF